MIALTSQHTLDLRSICANSSKQRDGGHKSFLPPQTMSRDLVRRILITTPESWRWAPALQALREMSGARRVLLLDRIFSALRAERLLRGGPTLDPGSADSANACIARL